MTNPEVMLPTRPLDPALKSLIESLKPGQRVRVTHSVRIGDRLWTTTAEGTFRDVNYLATGLSTQRVPEDDIVVPTIHFAKDNGELSSVALDENCRVEVV